MQASKLFATCSIFVLIADLAYAESAADIFREMDERKRASYSGVENYTQKKQTLGLCSLEYYEKETTQSTDGRGTISYMRLVPISEIAERNTDDPGMANTSPEELELIAGKLRLYGPQMESAMRNEMQQANLPGGVGQMLMSSRPDEPWLSANPNDMLGMYATMLEGAAAGKRQNAAQAAEAERQAADSQIEQIASRTRVMGRETVRNREAILLVAENLNQTQNTHDQEFTLNTMRLWVAADDYVPLKMSMEGIAREGNETRELKIEREDMEYRPVPGCPDLQEPFRTVMRISGVLNAEEQAQMVQAREQMAEMQSQLDSLPTAQKEMIMRQMGPQIEMMNKMAAGGGIEVISEVVGMRCNAGVPSNEEYAATLPGNMQAGCGAAGF